MHTPTSFRLPSLWPQVFEQSEVIHICMIYMLHAACCMMYDIWHMTYGIWHMTGIYTCICPRAVQNLLHIHLFFGYLYILTCYILKIHCVPRRDAMFHTGNGKVQLRASEHRASEAQGADTGKVARGKYRNKITVTSVTSKCCETLVNSLEIQPCTLRAAQRSSKN